MTKARDNATNVAGDISEVTAGTGLTGGGTSGTVTLTNDMATTINAAGDLIYGTGNDAYTRLALGTASQYLAVNSGATAPEWVTLSAGGMTLLSTTTLTGAYVTLSSIPNTYKDLYLVIRNFLPANDGTEFGLRFNADGTANRHRVVLISGAGNTATTFTSTYVNFDCAQDNSVGTGLIVATIADYANTTTWKTVDFLALTIDPTTTTSFRQSRGLGIYNQPSAISSFELFPASGNFTSGTALLYGVK